MKKLCLLIGSLVLFSGVFAQLRSIPAAVTDAFSSRYPGADKVEWKDKITYFEASFQLKGTEMKADFSSKGEWRYSEAQIKYETLPAAVKDGLTKSKYADWTKGTVAEIQHMGKAVQYRIYVEKSQPFQKRFLFFNAGGQLVKDALTL
ncbi:MAG TPA: PepSY-like domain-containing protein [Chitinophagaceae bacterium]|nr:PepSY-like domain-containing protein [Chitinophagaceae bacterium]